MTAPLSPRHPLAVVTSNLETDRLLISAILVLLIQSKASPLLIAALVYILM